jgi:hypothetical protein
MVCPQKGNNQIIKVFDKRRVKIDYQWFASAVKNEP